MTYANTLITSKLVKFALKVRKVDEKSWWVYRFEIGRRGELSQCSRVVFFGRSKEETDQWLQRQSEEATIYMLSDN